MLDRDRMREYMRDKRERWRKNGKCVDCGACLENDRYWRCPECRRKARVRQYRSLRKKAEG